MRPNRALTIQEIVRRFIVDVTTAIRAEIAREVVARLDRARAASGSGVDPTRRKGPVQLCPVPGCKDRAAPVFNMLCGKHKDTPKTKVKLYREQRRKRVAKARKDRSSELS